MQQRLIAGNWKMHKTVQEALAFIQEFAKLAPQGNQVEIAVAPPFIALHAVGQFLGDGDYPFKLAAQDLFWEEEGAFTGEISAPMLKHLGCHYVIIGHSERRRLFGETDEAVNKKVHAAIRHGLSPILCVGESLQERQAGRTSAIVREQALRGLQGVSSEAIQKVTLAYEPVWAIGTGHAASVVQAEEVHTLLRTTFQEQWGQAGQEIRILYGGSVTPENAGELFRSAHINGALVGKACLNPQAFAKIIHLASPIPQ